MNRKILIVEDNPEIANLIQLHLNDIFCESDIAQDGGEALVKFSKTKYDLIILDVMLPVMDGLDVCKKIREQSQVIPIIMLTARSSELDRVLGLEIGADDYLIKPFSFPELLARVKAQFRRLNSLKSENKQKQITLGELVIDINKHHVMLKNKSLDLTAKEFELLVQFASQPGRVYSRTELLDQVWGYSFEGYEHTVNSHINRLRAKLEDDPSHPKYLLTVWGVGYKFNEEPFL